ncbi:MAG: hydrogenase, partial [Lentisphaerota bacterium]
LGYQHRGIEEALLGGPSHRAIHFAETVAGDTSIGHATAYSQVLEALSGTKPPVRAQALRGLMLELERLANHIGDLGALANDVAYLPTASFNGRIRGDFLNMTALICGNRFGRGMIRPGGVLHDLEAARADDLQKRLRAGDKDTTSSVELLFDTPSVLARFENAGLLPSDMCRQLNIVGPAARAAGLPLDIRQTHPSGIYRFAQIPLSSWDSGDVFARAYVRWLEIQHSIRFIREQIQSLPGDRLHTAMKPLRPNHLAVALVEGWRGQICHAGITDPQGRLRRLKIVDPSFHNWYGLAYALRGQQISDFPLCNKSFNLSYCGNDL